MTAAFSRLAIVSATTKRATMTAGKRGDASAYLTGLFCTPLDPVSAEDVQRMNLPTSLQLQETFIAEGADIVTGDRLVVEGKDYPIRAVEKFTWQSGEKYLHLIIESLKASE